MGLSYYGIALAWRNGIFSPFGVLAANCCGQRPESNDYDLASPQRNRMEGSFRVGVFFVLDSIKFLARFAKGKFWHGFKISLSGKGRE